MTVLDRTIKELGDGGTGLSKQEAPDGPQDN